MGNDCAAGARRGLQNRCPGAESGAGFDSQAFPPFEKVGKR